MKPTVNNHLSQQIRNFILSCTAVLLFVFVFLPFFTNSFGVLSRMAACLDENGIDPTRYYYTDVEQVKEAEHYLAAVLKSK